MSHSIHEIYLSLSGEGITTGCPTVFIRVAGCSLRCGSTGDGRRLWCDTPYALSPTSGHIKTMEEIQGEVLDLLPHGGAQILITGGEPLEGSNRNFVSEFSQSYRTLCTNPYFPYPRIETNGAESIEGLDSMVFTIDYKLPGSGMEDRMNLKNFEYLKIRNNELDEIKFVVRDRLDYERSLEVYKEFQPNNWLLYSPVAGELSPQELAEWLKKTPIPRARLSLQIHKKIWGDLRGV